MYFIFSLFSYYSLNIDISSSLQLVPVLPSPSNLRHSQKSLIGPPLSTATASVDNISHHSSLATKMARIDSDHHLTSVDETRQLQIHHNHHLMPQSILSSTSQQQQPHHQQTNSPSRSNTTQHLAVLYQSHHHHHLHSVISGIRRQSRLPDIRSSVHQYQDVKA